MEALLSSFLRKVRGGKTNGPPGGGKSLVHSDDPYQKLSQILPQFQAAFFAQIRDSGLLENIPYIKLFNGDILFGYSDPTKIYFQSVFEAHGPLFQSIGLKPECFGAAFDALISYHHENCDTWTIRKSHFIPRGGIIFDVGVRGGHFAVKASRLVGQQGLVVAIDATDFARRYTDLHVRQNKLSNVKFVQAIVGDQQGKETEFFHGSSGETFSGIMGHTVDQEGKVVVDATCHSGVFHGTMRTLDGIAESLGLTACDLVIMQINGGEKVAIQGMDHLLGTYKPVLFITAFQRELGGIDPREEIKKMCSRFGYRIFGEQKASVILISK